jgi:hypothetical protein
MEGELHLMQRTLGVGAAMHAAVTEADAPTVDAPPRRRLTERHLCKRLSTLLKLPADKVDPCAPLEDYGVDSILALDLTRLLEDLRRAAETLFFEYFTLRELAGYFARSTRRACRSCSPSATGARRVRSRGGARPECISIGRAAGVSRTTRPCPRSAIARGRGRSRSSA